MSEIDARDVEAPDEALESTAEPDADRELADRDLETPSADAAEQRRDATGREERAEDRNPPLEADPADSADQSRVVELDEDDYR